MHVFTDDAGRTWELALTIGSIKRVMGTFPEINLAKIHEGDPPLAKVLAGDLILFSAVVYLLIKPQADARGVTDEDFASTLGMIGVGNALAAFWEENNDFFQSLDRRAGETAGKLTSPEKTGETTPTHGS